MEENKEKLKIVLLWICIIIGGIALISLLFSLFTTIITWLIRSAGIILLICFVVVAFNAIRGRLSR